MIYDAKKNTNNREVFLFLGLEMVFSFYWPVLLQQTPEEVEEYIIQKHIAADLADSLRRWFYSGYSIYENGYYLRRDYASPLNYVDAYWYLQQAELPLRTTPLEFYMISMSRRPIPAVLQNRPEEVWALANKYGATLKEEGALWAWVYSGKSIYKNPLGVDGKNFLDYYRDVFEATGDHPITEEVLHDEADRSAYDELLF